jgi:hypothetical protein|nr:MAG TPA: hypothetical protein [Caudoviricetes sp.]
MAEKKTADEAVNDTTAENTNAVDDAQAPSTTDTTDTAAEVATNADVAADTTAENADVVVEAPKNDATEMVVYAVDSTAVRIGDEYFYSSDWMITIPARLVEEAEKMGFVRVENA